jgi:hypothetical protein
MARSTTYSVLNSNPATKPLKTRMNPPAAAKCVRNQLEHIHPKYPPAPIGTLIGGCHSSKGGSVVKLTSTNVQPTLRESGEASGRCRKQTTAASPLSPATR